MNAIADLDRRRQQRKERHRRRWMIAIHITEGLTAILAVVLALVALGFL